MGDLKAISPVVGWGLVGYTGMSAIPAMVGKAFPMPAKDQNPAGYYGVKLLTAVGLGFIAGWVVNRQAARYVLAGATLTVAAEALNQYALAPAGLATYLPDTVNDVDTYLPGSEPLGYLSPGVTVDDYDSEESSITRLDPNKRL